MNHQRPMQARTLHLLALLSLALLLAAVPPSWAQTNLPSALPKLRYRGVVLSAADLKYAPHQDIIYPAVLRTGSRLENPLGQYYMYYAPHDVPGGICLAY